MKGLYAKNYKTLIKEIKDDLGNGKISYVLALGEWILLKWSYYAKHFTDLIQFLSNYPWHSSEN